MEDLIKAYNAIGQIYVRGEDAKRMSIALAALEREISKRSAEIEAQKKAEEKEKGGDDAENGSGCEQEG